MGGIKCDANAVSKQGAAQAKFMAGGDVIDGTFVPKEGKRLSSAKLKERKRSICKETGSCRGLDWVAQGVEGRLNLPSQISYPIRMRILAFLASDSVKTEQVIKLTKLAGSKTDKGKKEFDTFAYKLFLKGGLLVWRRGPEGSTGICYPEKSK